MPKMKTKSAAKKRFRLTGSGKIRRASAFRRHTLTKKARSRKRKLRMPGLVHKSNHHQIDIELPWG